jgi:MazG family protein
MNESELSGAFLALIELVSKLRGPGGCPWDAQQTDGTVKMYLLEEAYEVLDAIEKGNPDEVCQELGDLLFQIVFLARMAEERGEFDLGEVLKGITEKMINRHPHVFGTTKVRGAAEVAENWARIKKREKNRTSLLQGVPADLPALLRAHRLSERASKRYARPADGEGIWDEVETRFGELGKSIFEKGDPQQIGEILGEFLFALANLTRHMGLNAENLLREANRRFLDSRNDSKEA